MDEPIDPPSPRMANLFAAERARPEVDAEVAARVFSKLGTAVGVGVVAAAAGAAAAPTTVHAAAKAGFAAKAGLTAKTVPWLVAAFVAGGGVDAAVRTWVVPANVAPVAPPVTAPAPAPPPVVDAPRSEPSTQPTASSALPLPSTHATTSTAPRASATASTSTNDGDLAAERALIDRARMALARGQADSALEALEAHHKQFPRGRLAEEREALAIQALTTQGNTNEAARRAATFRKAYPHSVFLPAVERAAPSIKKDHDE